MGEINLLFLGYWSVTDGLSEATIRPHLIALSRLSQVRKIIYLSIERHDQRVEFIWNIPKVEHIPFYSPKRLFMIDKITDFINIPNKIASLCRTYEINKIFCRTSLAGALGYLVWRQCRIPFYVESFEPHAAYMQESGVWNKLGIRYQLQLYFEKQQKERASGLMPVSNNYKKYLKEEEGVKLFIESIPCTVDSNNFVFNIQKREKIRRDLKINENALVGVYVGKFGGIYYDSEAFKFFSQLFEKISNLHLIILSGDKKEIIEDKLKKAGCPINYCWVGKTSHDTVADYLSASDFAFNFHLKTNHSFALSPIKNGEYWANGLPILISKGIGDDSDIIMNEGGGLIVNYEGDLNDLDKLIDMIPATNQRTNNQMVRNCLSYRNRDIIKLVYKTIINS